MATAVNANANASANGGTASSTGMGSGGGSRGNNLLLFKWTPVNGANGGGGDGEQQQAAETATRRRRYVPVRILDMNGWLVFVPSSGAMWVRICNMIGSLAYYFRRCFEKHFSLCELSFRIVSCILYPWEMHASVSNWLDGDGFEFLIPEYNYGCLNS